MIKIKDHMYCKKHGEIFLKESELFREDECISCSRLAWDHQGFGDDSEETAKIGIANMKEARKNWVEIFYKENK